MPPVTTIATADGLRLSATVVGAGPAQIVVPNGAYFAHDLATVWAPRPALVYDLRNRGASEPVADSARLQRGVLQDVDDLETVRLALGADQIDLVAHSYVGVVAMLYAAAHPDRVRRAVLISPAPPDPAAHPTPPPDDTMRSVFTRLGGLQHSPPAGDAEERCRAFWEILAEIYVADPVHVAPVRGWGRAISRTSAAFSVTGRPMSSRRCERPPPAIGIWRA